MQTSIPLIRTKLRLPATRPNLVPRPRIEEQVLQGLRGRLTLITAPAGFGKTTLVASSITGGQVPVAWLSLDKDDNDEERFLRYLIAALQEVDKTIGEEAAQAVVESPQPTSEAVLIRLINDLDTRGREIILTLDDYQFIYSEAVHTRMAFLLEHCPETLHIVIVTRSDPPLPLARLRARGQMVELRAAELRFTECETSQFLNDVMGLHLDAEAIAVLEERTEGWVASLQMAALSMRNREDAPEFIEGFSGTNRYILDYLLEEVLASQSTEIQRFLLCTSILERLSAPLCEAVLQDEKWELWNVDKLSSTSQSSSPITCQQILEYLERTNLFLIPLDDERQWYRYHHLFADLLASQLQHLYPKMISGLHSRVSIWYEQNGWLDRAIEHAFAAGDLDRAARLIESSAQKLVYQVSFATIENWINRLPEEMVLHKTSIGITLGWIWVATGRINNLSGWLDKVEEHFFADKKDHDSNPEQQDILSNIMSLRAYIAFFKGDLQSCADLSSEALKRLSPSNLDLRVRILVQLGETLLVLQEFEQASKYLKEAVELGIALEDFQSVTTASMRLYKSLKTLGRLKEAEELIHRVLQVLSCTGRAGSPIATKLEQCWGDLLRERGRMAEADIQLAQALDHARQGNAPLDIITAVIYRSMWSVSQADLDGAETVLEEAELLIRSFTIPVVIMTNLALQRARVFLEKGELDRAEQYLRDPLREESKILRAKLLFKKGELEDAQRLLVQLEQDSVIGNRHGSLIQILLIQASVLRALGEQSRALEVLGRCLLLAHSQAYLMTFFDEGEPIYKLLELLQSQPLPQPLDIYVLQILQAFEQHQQQLRSRLDAELRVITAAQEKALPISELVEPLSSRELEVLRLIAEGKTNPEIAQQLFVASGTVKAHAASIYRKLDAANRTEAVARARKLAILP